MSRIGKLALGAAFLAGCMLASTAQAGWGSWGSYGGSYGSYGSYGSVSYGSYGSHGGWRRGHHRVRRVRYRSYASSGSWGGSYGSYGSYGGSYGSYGGSNGSYGGSNGSYGGGSYGGVAVTQSYNSCGSTGGTYYSGPVYGESYESAPMQSVPEPAPVDPIDPNVDPAPVADPALQPQAANSRDAYLTVSVPTSAQVFVNGMKTTSTGDLRQFVSRDLEPGKTYSYRVRAVVQRGGKSIERTKNVELRAGRGSRLAFDLAADAPAETTVKVHVPADARVYLSGRETKSTGPVRTFRTQQLKSGEQWNNYSIRVEWNNDGQLVQREQTVSIVGGQTKNVTFDLEPAKVAAR